MGTVIILRMKNPKTIYLYLILSFYIFIERRTALPCLLYFFLSHLLFPFPTFGREGKGIEVRYIKKLKIQGSKKTEDYQPKREKDEPKLSSRFYRLLVFCLLLSSSRTKRYSRIGSWCTKG